MKTENGRDVLVFMDSNGLPCQSFFEADIKCYQDAIRLLIEHCNEDFGKENTASIVAYALFKNNLSLDLSEYAV